MRRGGVRGDAQIRVLDNRKVKGPVDMFGEPLSVCNNEGHCSAQLLFCISKLRLTAIYRDIFRQSELLDL